MQLLLITKSFPKLNRQSYETLIALEYLSLLIGNLLSLVIVNKKAFLSSIRHYSSAANELEIYPPMCWPNSVFIRMRRFFLFLMSILSPFGCEMFERLYRSLQFFFLKSSDNSLQTWGSSEFLTLLGFSSNSTRWT